ncbi:MAG: hypothetical protein WB791_11260, partial [Waddliaceae bacterium]
MRIFGWMMGLAVLSTSQIIGSQNTYSGCYSCEPYNSCTTNCCDTDCCSQEKYRGFVDYLYWQVCRGDLAIGEDYHIRYTNPDFESGFRIGAAYSCGCWD